MTFNCTMMMMTTGCFFSTSTIQIRSDILDTIRVYIFHRSILPNAIGTTNLILHRTTSCHSIKRPICNIFFLDGNRTGCSAHVTIVILRCNIAEWWSGYCNICILERGGVVNITVGLLLRGDGGEGDGGEG